MIYADEVGCEGEMLRLNTLEGVWIKGRLRMWGRWAGLESYGRVGNMFNRLLASNGLTHGAVSSAMKEMERAGLLREELQVMLGHILQSKQKSHLAYCSPEEAMIIDRVISENLVDYPHLRSLVARRYRGRGKSVKEMAERLNIDNPQWCFKTCQRRITTWLNIAESILYAPMCDAFGTNDDKFTLPSVQKKC